MHIVDKLSPQAASPILQEYDASTVFGIAMNPAESGKIAARHNLVEIAEACRKEYSQATVGGKRTLAQWMGFAIATVAARLLARP